MRKTEQKTVQMEEIRAGLAKFCFRQLPSASADAQPMCGRETEDGKMGIIIGKAENGLNSRNKGGVGQILLPLASFSFRKLQSASADFRAMYGREVEAIISTKVKAPP